jgi:hypothetical protein
MKVRLATALLGALALAACGKPPEGTVRFDGFTPNSALQKDRRVITTSCPRCSREIDPGTAVCPDKNCALKISWRGEYTCGFCNGSKRCNACFMMENELGKDKVAQCGNCDGVGYKTWVGKTVPCVNCKGEKKCPICKGTSNCDFCKGEGKLTKEDAFARVKKSGEEGAAPAPAAAPAAAPAPAAPPEEKKP